MNRWTEFYPGVPLTVSKRQRRTNSTTSRVRGKKQTPRSRRSAPVPLPLPLPFQVSFPFFHRPAGKQCFQADRVNQGIVRLPITARFSHLAYLPFFHHLPASIFVSLATRTRHTAIHSSPETISSSLFSFLLTGICRGIMVSNCTDQADQPRIGINKIKYLTF